MLKITKNNKKIINLLADYPQRQFFTKEIADEINISLGGAHNSLKELVKENMVFKEVKGNMKFFQINMQNLLVKQLRITSVNEKILKVIKKIEKYSKKIILFGSASRGEQDKESDIDLFVLTNNPQEVKKISDIYSKKLLINFIIKTPNEWGEMEIKEPEFYNEVEKGIILYEQSF